MKRTLFTFVVLASVVVLALTAVTAAPSNPLRAHMRTVFPDQIKSVGQAARYILEPVGYRLLTGFPAPPEAATIAKGDIPVAITSHDRVMPIEDILLAMIGDDNSLVVDHQHKLVSFSRSSPGFRISE